MSKDQSKPSGRVKIGVTDLDGVLRAKYLNQDKFSKSLRAGLGFCNVIFGWDINDRLYDDYAPDTGFADARLTPDPLTERRIPWEVGLPLYLADFSQDKGFAGQICPRSLLRRIVSRVTEAGFEPRFGPEYEWFAYRETPDSLSEKKYQDAQPISPGMFGYSDLRTSQFADYHRDLFDQLENFGVELEGLHTETGPGVLEAAITHQTALEAADRAILFKQGVKSISYRHGFMASFMAKPSSELPGCGGHLHQSLWRDGKNVFYDEKGRYGLSSVGESYLAGQLVFGPSLMLLFAPNVNSYKRYVAGSWAATHFNWGGDNRTVALRLIIDGPNSTRLETRLPGADANPYLAIAACLAAGWYGIQHDLALADLPVKGSAYDLRKSSFPELPKDLGEAIAVFTQDERLHQLFGQPFCDHFLETRRQEWAQYQRAVTDWEKRRYFELA